MRIEVVEQSAERFGFNVTRCRYAEMYRALGIPELGAVLSCNRDAALDRRVQSRDPADPDADDHAGRAVLRLPLRRANATCRQIRALKNLRHHAPYVTLAPAPYTPRHCGTVGTIALSSARAIAAETGFRTPEKRSSGVCPASEAWRPHPHAMSLACAAFFVRPTACCTRFLPQTARAAYGRDAGARASADGTAHPTALWHQHHRHPGTRHRRHHRLSWCSRIESMKSQSRFQADSAMTLGVMGRTPPAWPRCSSPRCGSASRTTGCARF